MTLCIYFYILIHFRRDNNWFLKDNFIFHSNKMACFRRSRWKIAIMFYVVVDDHLKKFIYNLYIYIYIYIVLSCYFLYFTAVFFLFFFPLRTNFSKSEVFETRKKRTKDRVNTTNKKDNDCCEFKIREGYILLLCSCRYRHSTLLSSFFF